MLQWTAAEYFDRCRINGYVMHSRTLKQTYLIPWLIQSLKDTNQDHTWLIIFTGIALRSSGILFQFLCGVLEEPEAQLIHTLFSMFHCLIHELYPKNHHSSPEHAIYGTSCLLLAFMNVTYHLSNIRSINLILSLFPLILSLSSLLGLCIGHNGLSST